MLKGEISYSAGAMSKVSELQDCIDIVAQAGFGVVDFWLWRYSAGENAPMLGENWREWVQDVKARLNAAGLRVGQVHALWDHDMQIRDDFSFDLPGAIFHNSFEACAMLGAKRLIFHPIQRWQRMTDEDMRRRILDINVKWYGSLIPSAEKWGVELHLENLFDHRYIQSAGDPEFPFSAPEDILYVINVIGHPMVKACLDTGHANISGQDIPGMIRKYGSKLGSLHLNDNYGMIGPIYPDVHMFPSFGRIDWPAVFAALEEVGYGDTLNLEVNEELPKLSRALRLIHLRAGREILENMRDMY